MFISSNPTTEQQLFSDNIVSDDQLKVLIENSEQGFLENKTLTIEQRIVKVRQLIEVLKIQKRALAELMTREIGKPIAQSLAEIEKCISLCSHYAEKAEDYLSPTEIESEYICSKIYYQPLGVILGIMPWNFPFWQVFRFAVPSFLAGNAVIIKHAPNVGMSAKALQEVFDAANFGCVYQNAVASTKQCEEMIESRTVKGVSLTGSCKAGSVVAALAGANLKPQVLELGGSDVFIVNDSTELKALVKTAVMARLQNNGQSCIAAKRFLIQEELFEEFNQLLIHELEDANIGDPFLETTVVGPLARTDLKLGFEKQVRKAEQEGARLVYRKKHGQEKGCFVDISVFEVTDVSSVLMKEELFGPCFVLKSYQNIEEAIVVANTSDFGLSASVWTNDQQVKQRCIEGIASGAVFINQMSKSDPSMPFGGIKDSGYGRELGEAGIRSFVNEKLVVE